MTGILQSLLGSISSAAAVTTDAFFNLVTLLLPGNGTNGAQNNTFLDSSSNNFTITRNGNTTQGTFSPFSQVQGAWSNTFNANGGLSVPDQAAFQPGTGNFTVEGWVYRTSATDYQCLFWQGAGGSNNKFRWAILWRTTGWVYSLSQFGGGGDIANEVSMGTDPGINKWIHLAIVRNGNTFTPYINGVAGTTTTSSATLLTATSDPFSIGFANVGGVFYPLQGYISNFRYIKGSAVVPPVGGPTAPVTAVTNTQLLTCQDNRFKDNSTNNFSFTFTGTQTVQPFSPFLPTAAYSAATVGGSGYFDGSGDYLVVPSNAAFGFGTGDATIEAWIYPTTVSGTQVFLDTRTGGAAGVGFYLAGATLSVARDAVNVLMQGGTVVANAWNYVVWSRVGSTNRLFLNGTETANTTNSTSYATSKCEIGSADGGTQLFNGFISSVRVVKGSGVSSVTVPTAPFTNITNTSLLLNYTNAGITDATAKNDLETVGNAQISTTQSKFGGSSIAFDGNGDYLITPYMNLFDMWRGDLTVEGWVYFNSVANTPHLFMFAEPLQGGNRYAVVVYISGAVARLYTVVGPSGGDKIIGTTTLATGQWYHVALTKSGTTFTLWVNGVSQGTSTTTLYPFGVNERLTLGYQSDSGLSGDYLNGYMDDVRVTRGYARYTSAFTPPAAPFALQ